MQFTLSIEPGSSSSDESNKPGKKDDWSVYQSIEEILKMPFPGNSVFSQTLRIWLLPCVFWELLNRFQSEISIHHKGK